MAITALKSGAKLPLRPSQEGCPPNPKYKEVVKKIPDVTIYSLEPPLYCPFLCDKIQLSKAISEDEPEAFSP
jgi:hypothetical protein